MVQLRPDLLVFVGTKREMFPDGSRFEGVGINADFKAPHRLLMTSVEGGSEFWKSP